MAVDWLVVDGYDFAPAFMSALPRQGIWVLSLFDGEVPPPNAAIVLNQNCQKDGSTREVRGECIVLRGPRYFLARRSLLALREEAFASRDRPVVLVTVGGTDPEHVGVQIARDLAEIARAELEIRLACTTDEAGWAEAQALARTTNLVAARRPDLAHMMPGAAVAISAGGVTALELCLLGIVPVILIRSDDQVAGATALAGCGAAILAADSREAARAALRLIGTAELRREMAQAGTALVDGGGADRLIDELENFNCAKAVNF
jgi:spore coat polysaccharide biosynthesis predicted glycosyltransferase SpsG